MTQSVRIHLVTETDGQITPVSRDLPKKVLYAFCPGIRHLSRTLSRKDNTIKIPSNVVNYAVCNLTLRWLVDACRLQKYHHLGLLFKWANVFGDGIEFYKTFAFFKMDYARDLVSDHLKGAVDENFPTMEDFDVLLQNLPSRHELMSYILQKHATRLMHMGEQEDVRAFHRHLAVYYPHLRKYTSRLHREMDPAEMQRYLHGREQHRQYIDRKRRRDERADRQKVKVENQQQLLADARAGLLALSENEVSAMMGHGGASNTTGARRIEAAKG